MYTTIVDNKVNQTITASFGGILRETISRIVGQLKKNRRFKV